MQKLIMKWYYSEGESNEGKYFTQIIGIGKSVSFPSFCGGSQILNLMNACLANSEVHFEKRIMMIVILARL